MALLRELIGLIVSLISGSIAIGLGIMTGRDVLNYAALENAQRGKVWFAIGIIGIATTLSAACFLFRRERAALSSGTKLAIAGFVVCLVSGSIIFLSMPP